MKLLLAALAAPVLVTAGAVIPQDDRTPDELGRDAGSTVRTVDLF